MVERLLIHRLCVFRNAYPGIQLDLLTTTGLVDLVAREADIALRLTDKPPDYLVGREVLRGCMSLSSIATRSVILWTHRLAHCWHGTFQREGE